jgi:hypothetical protein
MKIKIGVMGSAEEMPDIKEKAEALGRAIAARDAILLTGATTGLGMRYRESYAGCRRNTHRHFACAQLRGTR